MSPFVQSRWLRLVPSIVLTAAVVAGQERVPADILFGETVDVALVELDVVVRDAEGSPVTDLAAADLRVFEDGEERPIASFSGRETASPGAAPGEGSPPTRSDSATFFAVFLDHAALRPDRRARVLFFIRRYFSSLRPQTDLGDYWFLALSNGPSVEVLIEPTSETVAFVRLLEELPAPPASSAQAAKERARLAEVLGEGDPGSGRGSQLADSCGGAEVRLIGSVAEYVGSVERRNGETIRGLDAAVTILGGLKGRKVLLYVGESVELEPGAEMVARLAARCQALALAVNTLTGKDITSDLRAVAANANSYGVSIYSIDAAGSRSEEFDGSAFYQVRTSNQVGALQILSENTGGAVFTNVGDPRFGLDRIRRDLANRFSLTFVSSPLTPGTISEVEVALSDEAARRLPRASVSHRRAIRRIDRTDELAAQLFSSMWLGTALNSLNIRAQASKESGNGVIVDIQIPVASLLFEELSDDLRLRLFLIARESDGRRRTLPKEQYVMVPRDTLVQRGANSYLSYPVKIELPPGVWHIAVGVSEEATSRVSTLRLESISVR